MPHIEVTAYEPDGQGGWFVEWHDPENLDGQPLTAYIHLTPGKLDELMEAREAVGGDCDGYRRAKDCCSEGPERDGELPPAVRLWLGNYDRHVGDCIDRVKLGVRDDAPQEALEDARAGRQVDPAHLRGDGQEPFRAFQRLRQEGG